MLGLIFAYPRTIAAAATILSVFLTVLWSGDPTGESAPLTVGLSLAVAAVGHVLLNMVAKWETARR